MNRYEAMYIIDTSVEEAARKELVEKFSQLVTDNGGIVEKVEDWGGGRRHLAFAIDYKTEGYYILMTFSSESALPRELERNLSISDSVIRYLVVKLEEKHSKVKPKPVRVAPAPVAEVAPAPEAAPAVEAAPEAAPAPEKTDAE
ncbi:MAG: 30S ribosomal protein S6 [Eubacteriales bacterium]|nr:30S ribosomal protein S6 [Eubacteriales bacterium]MDD3882814.1 30S ribosomal protein S6 [Eubacteriales bacterium]MDD4513288.1 30S ribosomal protein S6 [Eubacteriales bacterium]